MRLVSRCDKKTSLQKLLREELQVLMSDGTCCCCKCCCCKWCCCKCCCCCVKLAHPRPVFILRLKNLTTVLFQKWVFLFQCRLLPFLSKDVALCYQTKKLLESSWEKKREFDKRSFCEFGKSKLPRGPRSKDPGGIEPRSKRPAWPQQPNLYLEPKWLRWGFDS